MIVEIIACSDQRGNALGTIEDTTALGTASRGTRLAFTCFGEVEVFFDAFEFGLAFFVEQ